MFRRVQALLLFGSGLCAWAGKAVPGSRVAVLGPFGAVSSDDHTVLMRREGPRVAGVGPAGVEQDAVVVEPQKDSQKRGAALVNGPVKQEYVEPPPPQYRGNAGTLLPDGPAGVTGQPGPQGSPGVVGPPGARGLLGNLGKAWTAATQGKEMLNREEGLNDGVGEAIESIDSEVTSESRALADLETKVATLKAELVADDSEEVTTNAQVADGIMMHSIQKAATTTENELQEDKLKRETIAANLERMRISQKKLDMEHYQAAQSAAR